MDTIYSRKRIRMPKRKKKRRSKLVILTSFILLSLLVSILCFIKASYPIFAASCRNAAASKAVKIVNEEVQKTMNIYTYNDLMTIEKDENGKVNLIKANTVLMNQIISQIAYGIQERLDEAPTTVVYINYGSISGITKLKKWGPKFYIELESAGGIDTEIKSQFQTAGVNQTLHQIYLNVNTWVNILTPIGTYEKQITPQVLLTEAIIVGEIPNTYYNLEGMTRDDALNILE